MSKTAHGTEVVYIGDGVYAEFDGYGVELLANNHEHPTDKIYLEPYILETISKMLQSGKYPSKEENE